MYLRGQHSSKVAHWLSVSGDHGSNTCVGEKNFLICFWDLMIAIYLRIYYNVCLSTRLNDLRVGHKTYWSKISQGTCGRNWGANKRTNLSATPVQRSAATDIWLPMVEHPNIIAKLWLPMFECWQPHFKNKSAGNYDLV